MTTTIHDTHSRKCSYAYVYRKCMTPFLGPFEIYLALSNSNSWMWFMPVKLLVKCKLIMTLFVLPHDSSNINFLWLCIAGDTSKIYKRRMAKWCVLAHGTSWLQTKICYAKCYWKTTCPKGLCTIGLIAVIVSIVWRHQIYYCYNSNHYAGDNAGTVFSTTDKTFHKKRVMHFWQQICCYSSTMPIRDALYHRLFRQSTSTHSSITWPIS